MTTGDTCELEFKPRSGGFLSSNANNINAIEGIVKDKDGLTRFRLEGKYTTSMEAFDVVSFERWNIFKAPELP